MSSVVYKEQFKTYEQLVTGAMVVAVHDVENDIVGVARGSAPHLRGQLEKSIHSSAKISPTGVEVVIDASAKGKNGYDYAPYIHNSSYNLGEKSRSKSGGMSAISGTTLSVGNGFIQKPVELGEQAYINHFENALRGVNI